MNLIVEILPTRKFYGWFWRIKAKNGQILCHSEVYIRKRNCLQTARKIHMAMPGSKLKES
jgi:uncharacterized protein YegP (UPF0339 family)